MHDLLPEICSAIDRIEQRHIDALIAAGVPEAIAHPQNGDRHRWGIAKVLPDGDFLYSPDDEFGREAYVVFSGCHGRTVDMIAFGLAKPGTWRWRSGLTRILNAERLQLPFFLGQCPELVATPLDWLRSGCETMVILDWSSRADIAALGFENEIIAPDMIARRLEKTLSRGFRVPHIRTKSVNRDAA
jgi:hypothetical protein